MLTNLAFVFIFVRASSALVQTSAFLQPVVCKKVYKKVFDPCIQVYMGQMWEKTKPDLE